MARPPYERLTALDASFLELEDENSPLQVGAVAVFGPGPLCGDDGGVELESLRDFVESRLHRRYRQRVDRMPVTDALIWVDDARFNLAYHIRHVSVPRPGDERQLKRLAGQVLSLPLDHKRPLWEMWVVEGLADGGFALIFKAHHCMVDGIAGANLLTATMQFDPDAVPGEPTRWRPRPAPVVLDVVFGELRRYAEAGGAMLEVAGEAFWDPRRAWAALTDTLDGLGEAIGAGAHSASETSLNVPTGPHRRFDWLRYELADVKAVKNRLGGTVNDVVLANVSGALRRFLTDRGDEVEALDFRAMVPVNTRRGEETGPTGNRVATLAVQLPLDEADPRERLRQVVERTQRLKASKQAAGIEAIGEISDWGLSGLFLQLARMSAATRPFNLVVTNVPGPQRQAWLLGCPLRAIYPMVPLYAQQALGVALFSYDGGLYWGLNADWDSVPDLHALSPQ